MGRATTLKAAGTQFTGYAYFFCPFYRAESDLLGKLKLELDISTPLRGTSLYTWLLSGC